jgi:hypothetical protein
MVRVLPSTNHPNVEESLLEGLRFEQADIIDGVGFTMYVYADQNTWGVYNLMYRIIN